MDFIIRAISLILLNGFSPVKTVTLILRWPEINTYFHSVINSTYSPATNPNKIRNNLFRSDEELCEAVTKSNFFDINKEEYSIDQSSSSSKFNRRLSNLISRALNIEDATENDFTRKDRKVKYDNTEIKLLTFPCHILPTKIVYLSHFYIGEINVYFLFAKMMRSDIPQLLAAIGKDEALTLTITNAPFYYSHTWDLIDMTERNRIYEKVLKMTPTQCAWLCAIMEELRSNMNYRRYKFIYFSE